MSFFRGWNSASPYGLPTGHTWLTQHTAQKPETLTVIKLMREILLTQQVQKFMCFFSETTFGGPTIGYCNILFFREYDFLRKTVFWPVRRLLNLRSNIFWSWFFGPWDNNLLSHPSRLVISMSKNLLTKNVALNICWYSNLLYFWKYCSSVVCGPILIFKSTIWRDVCSLVHDSLSFAV